MGGGRKKLYTYKACGDRNIIDPKPVHNISTYSNFPKIALLTKFKLSRRIRSGHNIHSVRVYTLVNNL